MVFYVQYRDFVFRKMFEKPAISFEARAEEIVRNVRELTTRDPRSVISQGLHLCKTELRKSSMFLTRTVAAEVCMEAKSNELAYTALKRLDRAGLLKFKLSCVFPCRR